MRVTSIRYKSLAKICRLNKHKLLRVHRYCCIGIEDDIILRGENSAFARCKNGHAQILPSYNATDSVKYGTRILPLIVKEIETAEEIEGYHKLEECHYRGKILHGRRVPLVVSSKEDPLLPKVLGYIELSTAFIMNRPRAILLDDTFYDSNSKISWTSWKKDTMRQYTNLIVRIARCVISPEFRGLGLSRVLVKHAAKFARSHWHVGKLKPLFLEITADMLRYVPFVESAGMHYIGDTEGNLNRINKDMNYLLKNFDRVKQKEILKEESGGIVDLQVFYATYLKQIEDEHNITREQILELLLQSPYRLSERDWDLLHRIFRMPKPTFIMGLTPDAERFICQRIKRLGLPKKYPALRPPTQAPTLQSPIEIKECTLRLVSPLIRTNATRRIQQAFGVSRDMLTTTLFSNLSFTIKPGDIVLICGPSGAGKTTLLYLLSCKLKKPDYNPSGLQGIINVPKRATVSILTTLKNSRPLVNSLGKVSFENALFALNVSGLAEAHLYVKRFHELSNGQRYRAMVAKLIASRSDVWIVDEFCATLDPITANIVSRNLRRCAKELGVTVILAAANWAEFIHELRPDITVHLLSPWDYRIFSWPELQQAIKQTNSL